MTASHPCPTDVLASGKQRTSYSRKPETSPRLMVMASGSDLTPFIYENEGLTKSKIAFGFKILGFQIVR